MPLANAPRIEPVHKRIRAIHNGKIVIDTANAKYVWEHNWDPRYYFPINEVSTQVQSTPGAIEVDGYVTFDWDVMDGWYEEDEEVFVHPRNPYTRIDAMRSSRHVQVELDGQTVADSTSPTILFETGLPPRYYLPPLDVRLDLLTPSETTSACPYKGFANYFNLGEHQDAVWTYPTTLPEARNVIGLYCFYNERVDLIVDGERLERPATKFS